MGYFKFFKPTRHFNALYPTLFIKILFFFKSIKSLFLKSKKNYGDNVKNKSAGANKI